MEDCEDLYGSYGRNHLPKQAFLFKKNNRLWFLEINVSLFLVT